MSSSLSIAKCVTHSIYPAGLSLCLPKPLETSAMLGVPLACAVTAPRTRQHTFLFRFDNVFLLVIRISVERLQAVGKEFFDLPQEEKEAYTSLEGVTEDRSQGYVTKLKCTSDGRQGWSDFYFHTVWPPSVIDFSKWPKHPSYYREVTEKYGRGINLGLEESTVKNALGGEDLEMELKINYYPACLQPEMALGVLPYTDMCILTVLNPNEVPGLQILKNNEWVTAKYVANTLIIHIGDQLQTLSNGKYKSVLHRTLVSKDKLRMSWPVFCIPPLDLVVGPLKQLIDEDNPPLFEAMSYREFKQRKKSKADEKSS